MHCTLAVLVLLCAGDPRADIDYLRDIKPIFKARCYACHGARKQESGLRLDTVAAMRQGSENGNVLNPDEAVLLYRVTADEGERMPPEGARLSDEQIARIKAWIAAGAPAPIDEQPDLDPRRHWAYQLPQRAGSDIDTLLAAHLSAQGLKPQVEAAPEVWLRRAYLDLIGLPPTAEEVRAFQRSFIRDPQVARADTVERLLNSTAYGERWARHLMDIWRYADWYGLGKELRNSQKHIWHWRDWIVESLNADKGYDRMIIEMLAADEESPDDRDALRATGFLARSYYIFNRTTWLDEVIEHTNRAFLGITMQCAKCHDHKYDPIEHADYYRMRAIFEPYHVRLDAWPGVSDFEQDGLPRAFDLHVDRPTYLHVRGDEKDEDKSRVIEPGVPAVLGGQFSLRPVSLPWQTYAPGVTEDNLRTLERETLRRVSEARTALTKALPDEQPLALKQLEIAEAGLKSLRARAAADEARFVRQTPSEALNRAAAHTERQVKALEAEAATIVAEQALTKLKADANTKPEAVSAAEKAIATAQTNVKAAHDALAKTEDSYTSIEGCKIALVDWVAGEPAKAKAEAALGEVFPTTSTGRRLAFARWIADKSNPLTARVIVNHVWTRHFGASLVPDVSDFGLRCRPPVHQDLLDTLAVDLKEHGWSLKQLHKQLVLSRLYCTSSSNAGVDPDTLAADPDNVQYWRMNPRRLESQAVHDALLSVAGKLDLGQGGPSIEPSEPSPRRGLYFVQTPDIEHRFLAAFDNSNVLECYRRQESVAPQQALALANSKLTRESADALAARLAKLDEAAFVQEAFLTLLGRAPSTAEAATCSQGLATLSGLQPSTSDALRARALFLQALISHNDFITLR